MNNKFTSVMVDNYAEKLLIGLTKEENKMVLDEFNFIDKMIDKINTIPGLNELEPMTHCLDDFECDLAEDIAEDSIPVSDALRNAGSVENNEIEIPKVVE